MSRRTCARVALLLAVYAGVSVWLTWPLASRAMTDLPNPAGVALDILAAAWLLSWHTHALATHPSILPHPNAFHPASFALFYAPPALGPLPLFAPVYLASGSTPLAYDVAFLAAMALAATSTAEVVRRWTRSPQAAFLAGLALIANPMLLGSTGTAPLCTMLVGLPWVAYSGARRPLGARTSAVLVGALVLQGLVDPIFGMLGALTPLGLITCTRLVRGSARRSRWSLLWCGALAGALLSPLYVGYVAAWRSVDHRGPWGAPIGKILSEAVPKLPPPPSVLHAPSTATDLFIAIVALGALRAWYRGAIADPVWRHAALWTTLGWLCALPAVNFLYAIGHLELLDHLGPLRSLARLSTNLLVGAPLLLGVAVGELCHRLNSLGRSGVLARRLLVGTAGVVMLAGVAPRAPYGTVPAPSLSPELQAAVARSGGPVLELPAGRPISDALAMYHSIGGWWPVLNGYASFWPPGFAERLDAMQRLPDHGTLQRLVAETGVRTIIVTPRAMPMASGAVWIDRDTVARSGLRRVAEADGVIVFAVDLPG